MQSLHPDETRKPPLVLVVGPTAVGKTEAAIGLAEGLDGEIVSADSRLFYRGMDIGTAKPTADERRRVPHHLVDVAQPDEIWSLAVFQQQARQVITKIHRRGRLPVLVGGTGQYVRAVAQGWQPPPVAPNPHLRQALESQAQADGPDGLHRWLWTLDPLAAEKIDARNLRRTVRALEVVLTTGRRFSEQQGSGPSPYRLLTLGLSRPRPALFARIDRRIDAMLAAGLVDEVRGLLEQGYSADLSSLSAIGYREIAAYLHGRLSLDQAVVEIRRNTRVYVRRQANWFKADDSQIHWFDLGEGAVEDVLPEIEAVARTWLEL